MKRDPSQSAEQLSDARLYSKLCSASRADGPISGYFVKQLGKDTAALVALS